MPCPDAGTSRQVERERERKPNVGRAGIAAKLNGDMEQMRSEANTSREALRGLIEAKVDHSTHQQGEAAKALRDELGGNFQRLGARVSESLGESSRTQKERLENVTSAVSGLSEKLASGADCVGMCD